MPCKFSKYGCTVEKVMPAIKDHIDLCDLR